MISPQASVHFLLIPRRSLNLAVDSSLNFFSPSAPHGSQSIIKKRGTLEILPFSKDGVFDCIHKLCRHPVDPILRSFCWTQLKSLRRDEEKDQRRSGSENSFTDNSDRGGCESGADSYHHVIALVALDGFRNDVFNGAHRYLLCPLCGEE